MGSSVAETVLTTKMAGRPIPGNASAASSQLIEECNQASIMSGSLGEKSGMLEHARTYSRGRQLAGSVMHKSAAAAPRRRYYCGIMPTDYLKRILTARVYDVASESPLEL